MKDRWVITELTAQEAHEIVRSKRTGSLTTHFSQGVPTAYEWKEKRKIEPVTDNVRVECDRVAQNFVDRNSRV